MSDEPEAPEVEEPEEAAPEEAAPAAPAPVVVVVKDDDGKAESGQAFLQKVIVTILGPTLLVVVTGWANHRFNVTEKKAEDTKSAVVNLNKTISNLEKLLESAKKHDVEVRQQSRTDLANLRMTVIRLEGVIRLAALKVEVERRTKFIFDRFGAAPAGSQELARQKQMVLKGAVRELKLGDGIDEAQALKLSKLAGVRFDELASQQYRGALDETASPAGD